MEEKHNETIDRRKDIDYGDRIIDACANIKGVSEKLKGFIKQSELQDKYLDKRINGSIDSIKLHILQGSKWRLAILMIALGLIVQVGGFIYFYGRQTKQVEINTENITELIRMNFLINKGLKVEVFAETEKEINEY